MSAILKRKRYSPIGLDIGSGMIKLIQLQYYQGKLSVACGYIGRVPENAFEGGLPVNRDILAQSIRNTVQNNGFRGRIVNISLNPQSFYFRTVSFPELSNAELKKAMYWEAAHNFPIPDDQILLDFCQMNNFPNHEKANRDYILAATANRTANIYTSIAEEAGLVCPALEVEPLSLFRSVTQAQQAKNVLYSSPLVLINIGYFNTILIVTKENHLSYYRCIKVGVYNFIKTIQDINNCDFRTAEAILYNRKVPLDNKLLSMANQFAVKIGQSLDSWHDQHEQPEESLQEIYFCGGGAFVPNLATIIGNHFKMKIKLFNPLANLNCTNQDHAKSFYRKSSFFPIAHGLTLRGWNS